MATPQLTKGQRDDIFAPLMKRTNAELERLAAGDEKLLWALRRKLAKELVYLERSTPMVRAKLKMKKWIEQKGICPLCNQLLPEKKRRAGSLRGFWRIYPGEYAFDSSRMPYC
jgi:hypothetical protein